MTYKSLELSKPEEYQLESLEVGLTSSCNFKCDYCCAYQRNDGQSIGSKEVIRILEELPTLKRVRLSGGEVTLRYADCLEVVKYCSGRGISTQLNTNASVLNKEQFEELHRAGVSNIHISLNFTTAEAHAAYYKLSPNIFDRIIENIKHCVHIGQDTVIETLLFAETQTKLKDIHHFIYQLGVRRHEIQNSIRMDHSGWNAIAAREELKEAVHQLISVRKPDMTLYFTCMDRFAERLGLPQPEGVHYSHCVDGKKQLHLHGNGDILICELCYPVVIGNVYEGTSLKDIYANKPAPLADYLERLPCPALEAVFPKQA